MDKEKETNEKPLSDDEEINDPAGLGKKAIEADRKVNPKNNSSQQKADEKKDAEQWRNEG